MTLDLDAIEITARAIAKAEAHLPADRRSALSPDVVPALIARLRAAEAVCRAVGPIDPVAYERWRVHLLDE